MKITNIYTSIACNRTTEAADWGNNGWIVFGACNAVGLYDPKYNGTSAKILHTWVAHQRRVNTVQWIRGRSGATQEQYFLSGADDGLAILWNIDDLENPKSFPLKGHESGVNAVCGIQRSDGSWLLATAAADSTLKLWTFDGQACRNFQTILLKRGFCFTLRLAQIPNSEAVLLAFSSDDETVSLWCQMAGRTDDQFQLVHKLVGHEDWVRGLDFVVEDDDLLLASSAQDNFIRMWRIAKRSATEAARNKVDLFHVMDEQLQEIRMEEKIVQLGESSWVAISLESVLYGHEGWVYGVHWHKSAEHGLRLLSASIDKSLIVWAPTEDGIWMEKVRVGDVGGNSLGFFGGKFSSDGKTIFGHSYTGGFHMWTQSAEHEDHWQPDVIVAGHYGEVRDLAWEPSGEYLLTVSADQSTRIHAPWVSRGSVGDDKQVTWHEIARPQVHGYDMQALAVLSRYKFASGAEEKITRTFQSSANFIENFRRLTGVVHDDEGDALLARLPKGASVPSLGLSNKAVFSVEASAPVEKHVKDQYPENYFVPVTLDTPPQEETLMQNTLWPEVHKLYGHGYEIYALAATRDGRLLASTCRANNAEHAQIILWNTATWKQSQKLAAHQLTVTQMRFSPDGRYLVAVSRDRSWSLYESQQQDGAGTDALPSYALAVHSNKTNSVHGRIIWSCDWSHDSKLFATSSRDGKVVAWAHTPLDEVPDVTDPQESQLGGWHALAVLELKNTSITAVAFATTATSDGAYIVAVGSENGTVGIYKLAQASWTLVQCLSNNQAHHLTVKRLQFRPCAIALPNQFQLASCGDDQLVRIYEFQL